MPGRAGSPTEASSGYRASNPFTSVPSDRPAPGCTTRPAGLATTMTSSSSYRTVTATLGSGPGGAGEPGSAVTSTVSPAASRRLLLTVSPSTNTAPAAHIVAASVLDQSRSNPSARSTRSPSSVSGTTNDSGAARGAITRSRDDGTSRPTGWRCRP